MINKVNMNCTEFQILGTANKRDKTMISGCSIYSMQNKEDLTITLTDFFLLEISLCKYSFVF